MTPNNILVPSDLSPSSNSIFPHAITIAQASASKLYLLHVMHPTAVNEPERLEDFPPIRDFFSVDRENGFTPPLKRAAAVGKSYLYNDDPGHVILEMAKQKHTDLICMASTTSGGLTFPWWSAGKTIERIVRRAPCSVLCLRGHPVKPKDWKRPHFRHILLLTELGDTSGAALQNVLPWVQRFNSILHVFPLQKDGKPTTAESNTLRDLCQTNPSTNVLHFAKPEKRVENLLSFVHETPIELIAMTPRTRMEFSNRLISDVFVRLMRAADCPILVLR